MKLITFILIYFFSQFSFAGISEIEKQKISEAIKNNGFTQIESILKEYKQPFRCEQKRWRTLLASQKSHYCDADSFGSSLLKETLKQKPCYDNIILLLVKNGARFDNGGFNANVNMITSISLAGCKQALNNMLENSKPNEIYHGYVGYSSFMENKFKSSLDIILDGETVNPRELESFGVTNDAYRAFLNKKCPKEEKKNPYCETKEYFHEVGKNIDKIYDSFNKKLNNVKAERDYANSPKGLSESICEYEAVIVNAQNEINREKKINQVSGTVNLVTLNQAGKKIVDYKEAQKELLTRYKKKVGKAFNIKNCY